MLLHACKKIWEIYGLFFHERKKVRFSIFVTIYSNTTVYGNLLKMSQFSKKILFLKLILKENRIFLIFFPDFFQSETFFFFWKIWKISKIPIFWKSRKYQFFENVIIYFQTETFFWKIWKISEPNMLKISKVPIFWKSGKSQFFENLIFVLKIKYNETSH